MRLHLSLLLLVLSLPARAAVLITHYNSFALLDVDGITPLAGDATQGDVIQVIDAGLDGLPSAPDAYGLPSGDDFFLGVFSGSAVTHVGDNEPFPNWDQGLYNDTLTVADGSVGLGVYLRFWNGFTPDAATHYGETAVVTIPSAPVLGPAFLDFVPTAGSSRTVSIPFAALASFSVPEPGSAAMFALTLLCLRTGRNLRRQIHHLGRGASAILAAAALGLAGVGEGRAQLTAPLDVTASRAILGPVRRPLPGTSPDSALFSFAAVPGALVHILQAGANGRADLPAADGAPAGDDLLVAELAVGQGIAPGLADSGAFSTTIFRVPAPGTLLFARAFNAPTRAESTHWGQSALFAFEPLRVMDVSQLGLLATTLPLGVDLAKVDSDGDGRTDLEELRANTSALDPADLLRILSAGGVPTLRVEGKAGRRYLLERMTGELASPLGWEPVATSGMLNWSRSLLLSDPNPPGSPAVIYRIRVEEE